MDNENKDRAHTETDIRLSREEKQDNTETARTPDEPQQLEFDFVKEASGKSTDKDKKAEHVDGVDIDKISAGIVATVSGISADSDESDIEEQLTFNFGQAGAGTETGDTDEDNDAIHDAKAGSSNSQDESSASDGVHDNAAGNSSVSVTQNDETGSDIDTHKAAGAEVTSEATPEPAQRKHIVRKLLAAVIVLVLAAYCGGIYFFNSHFLPFSYAQGVDISLLDAAEAEQKLQADVTYDSITLTGRTGEEKLDLSDTDVSKTFSSLTDAINAQDKLGWGKALFERNRDIGVTMSASCDEAKLDEKIGGLMILNPEYVTLPENAHAGLNTETNRYELVAELEGNHIDENVLREVILAAISEGKRELNLEDEGVYTEPEIRADDAGLASQIEWMNAINEAGAVLDLDAGVVIPVNGEFVGQLVGSDGMADEQAVRDYVSSLALSYNTVSPDKTRTFINHNNIEKTIKTSYGWQLNEDETTKRLYELINKVINDTTTVPDADSGEQAGDETDTAAAENTVDSNAVADNAAANADAASAEEQGVFNPEDYLIKAAWKRAAAKHEEPDYGASYVEIDMGEQNVYVYVDGVCVLSSPCVTGRMTKGRITPEGMYSIQYKQRSRYLTGRNPDGSISYRSYVNYWMPFNGGIGLHDATWRGKFGGSIYVYSGSHGCINLPLDIAKQLYDIAYAGMPVICYY